MNTILNGSISFVTRPLMMGMMIAACTACGGGGSSTSGQTDASITTEGEQQSQQANEQGQSQLYVALTDAEGDFLTYEVDVSGIVMTRSNGAVVNVLPNTTRVDFAQYVEVTEFLTVLDAPSGRYTSASITLDFSEANITVQDESGSPISANVVDSVGQTLTQTTLDITFNDNAGFTLAPGVPAQITLDFDLDASNTVVIEEGVATVTVNPVLVADTLLEAPKTFRLRGLLGNVDAQSETFVLDISPFNKRRGGFGDATVYLSDDTQFEVDGSVFDLENGLNQLEALGVGAAIITEGQWSLSDKKYQASMVYAGSSVPWGESDIVRGTVVARTGDSMTVRGAIVQLAEGSFFFNDTFTVIFSDTTILRHMDDEAPTPESISIGSAITATGDITDNELDASSGIVRISPSVVSGTVVTTSPLSLDLTFINGRRASIYDFSGTGASIEADADPEDYSINTGSLDVSSLALGGPVRSIGYVTDFGSAPEDFNASSVIDASSARGILKTSYGRMGSEGAIVSADETGIVFSVDHSEKHHHLILAGIPQDLKTFETLPVITSTQERGVFTLKINQTVALYTYYDAFVEGLNEALSEGGRVTHLSAHGFHDGDAGTFTTRRMGVTIQQ